MPMDVSRVKVQDGGCLHHFAMYEYSIMDKDLEQHVPSSQENPFPV